MRGKHKFKNTMKFAGRIIPASAGQTPCRGERSRVVADHPRECGANVLPSAPVSTACGSSPRVRGKPRDTLPATGMTRIIPASAGQTAMPLPM